MGLGSAMCRSPIHGSGIASAESAGGKPATHVETCQLGLPPTPQALVAAVPLFDQAAVYLKSWAMTSGAHCLEDLDWPVVRLYCPDCGRFAQFRRATLIERFGPDQNMPDMLRLLQPCDRPNDMRDRCRLVYWDRLKADSASLVVAHCTGTGSSRPAEGASYRSVYLKRHPGALK